MRWCVTFLETITCKEIFYFLHPGAYREFLSGERGWLMQALKMLLTNIPEDMVLNDGIGQIMHVILLIID